MSVQTDRAQVAESHKGDGAGLNFNCSSRPGSAMVLLSNHPISSSFSSFTIHLNPLSPVHRQIRTFSYTHPRSLQLQRPNVPFTADYLITSCAFSPDKAGEATTQLHRTNSVQQSDAVLDFFRTHAFEETQIRTLISLRPKLLSYNVDKTLEPRLRALNSLGFSPSDIIHLVLSSPDVLSNNFSRIVLPKLQLWISLLGSTDCLMKFLRKNQWILGYSVEKTILPNLTLLRSCGISDERISMVMKHHPRFIVQKPSSLKAHTELVERLGVPPQSGMFLWALQAVRMVSGARFKAKLGLMMSMGWSEQEFHAAFCRAPVFLSVSEATMRKKMGFLVNEAGCEPAYLALKPVLLMYSLEKRLIPRYRVMEILKARGLRGGDYKLHTIMDYSEKKFIEKFVLSHDEEAPELYQLYITGRNLKAEKVDY